MVLRGDEAQVDACFGLFVDSLILMPHRSLVCAERTIGSEIVLNTNLLGDIGHVKSRFNPFGDSVTVSAR
jgi:hypothetical protein